MVGTGRGPERITLVPMPSPNDATASASVPRAYRRTVSYIDKSRVYYAAHGYDTPYAWATFGDVPFTPAPPLASATVSVVTTAFPADYQRPKKVQPIRSSPTPAAMFTADLSWDKDATHTDDVGSFLPLDALQSLRSSGRIGAVADRFYAIPTVYSQRRTNADAAKIAAWCKEDGVDAVLLAPI